MVQTYMGYFLEDGRFVPDGTLVRLPARRRAIVNIFDEEMNDESSDLQSTISPIDKLETIRLIIAKAINAESDTLTEDDWGEMQNLRTQTNAGLSRAVEV